MEVLILIAENGGMFARIGVIRPLNRNVVRASNPDRKDTPWGKTRLRASTNWRGTGERFCLRQFASAGTNSGSAPNRRLLFAVAFQRAGTRQFGFVSRKGQAARLPRCSSGSSGAISVSRTPDRRSCRRQRSISGMVIMWLGLQFEVRRRSGNARGAGAGRGCAGATSAVVVSPGLSAIVVGVVPHSVAEEVAVFGGGADQRMILGERRCRLWRRSNLRDRLFEQPLDGRTHAL